MGCGSSKFRTTAGPQCLELGLTVADKHVLEAKDSHHQLATIPAGLGNSLAHWARKGRDLLRRKQ